MGDDNNISLLNLINPSRLPSALPIKEIPYNLLFSVCAGIIHQNGFPVAAALSLERFKATPQIKSAVVYGDDYGYHFVMSVIVISEAVARIEPILLLC